MVPRAAMAASLRSKQALRRPLPLGRSALPLLLACGGLLAAVPVAGLLSAPALAQEAGYGQTINSPQQERELDYGTGPARNNVLDATNPIDLMNRLQRATAMDDATPPADAIDAALRDFQSQPVKAP